MISYIYGPCLRGSPTTVSTHIPPPSRDLLHTCPGATPHDSIYYAPISLLELASADVPLPSRLLSYTSFIFSHITYPIIWHSYSPVENAPYDTGLRGIKLKIYSVRTPQASRIRHRLSYIRMTIRP